MNLKIRAQLIQKAFIYDEPGELVDYIEITGSSDGSKDEDGQPGEEIQPKPKPRPKPKL